MSDYRKRGRAQRDGCPPLFYRRRTFVAACENFVTMATEIDRLAYRVPFARYHYIAGSLKPPLWYKNLALISCTSRVITNFMSKWSTCRYRGNRGRSGANLNDTMKLANLENLQFGTGIWDISHISYTGRVEANFLFKYQIFVTMATWVGHRQVVVIPLNRMTRKKPFGTKIWELSPMEPIRQLGGLGMVLGERGSPLLLIHI